MEIEQLLREEIQLELEQLKDSEVGTDKHKETVDSVAKLTDRVIEMEKIDVERQTKLKQMDDDRKDRLIKNVLNGLNIGLPLVVLVWGTLKTFEFEKEGTVTTIIGRGIINKLIPKK